VLKGLKAEYYWLGIQVDSSEKIKGLLMNRNLVQATDSALTIHAADAIEEALQQNGYRPPSVNLGSGYPSESWSSQRRREPISTRQRKPIF
jgi:hypothetical protein